MVADDSDVRPELEVVVPPCPGHVVGEVVNRGRARHRPVEQSRFKDEPEENLILIRIAEVREGQPRQSVLEVIDQRLAHRPRVPDYESERVRPETRSRSVGELRSEAY